MVALLFPENFGGGLIWRFGDLYCNYHFDGMDHSGSKPFN